MSVEKTNKETAAHIREFMQTRYKRRVWAWPTDGCGYDQHIKFVTALNKWRTLDPDKDTETYEQMVERYCILLEQDKEKEYANNTETIRDGNILQGVRNVS